MGCGESKHDVVSGNTVLRRKKSDDDVTNSKINIAKDIETVDEKPASAEGESTVNHPGGGDQLKNDVVAVDENYKTTSFSVDEKRNDDDELDQEAGRSICRDSPNHFFSSRKDNNDNDKVNYDNEEPGSIDGIISEGHSGKSEYNTPRHGAGPEILNDINLQHNGEAVNVDEEINLVRKENEVVAETTSSALEAKAEEDHKITTEIDNEKQKHAVGSPRKDLKAM